MFRKTTLTISLCVLLSLMIGTFGFASETGQGRSVSADDIILEEPKLLDNNEINQRDLKFLIVNINNNISIYENPISVSLVRLNQNLDILEAIRDRLNVSIMRVMPGSALNNRSVQMNRVYSMEESQDSETYETEVTLINRYFEIKDQMDKNQASLLEINSVYGFDSMLERSEEASKLSPEALEVYMDWMDLKTEQTLLKNEYIQVAGQYLELFETVIYSNQIDRMSFSDELKPLSVGTYALRFTDSEGKLIKQIDLKVTVKESSLVPLMPLNSAN